MSETKTILIIGNECDEEKLKELEDDCGMKIITACSENETMSQYRKYKRTICLIVLETKGCPHEGNCMSALIQAIRQDYEVMMLGVAEKRECRVNLVEAGVDSVVSPEFEMVTIKGLARCLRAACRAIRNSVFSGADKKNKSTLLPYLITEIETVRSQSGCTREQAIRIIAGS